MLDTNELNQPGISIPVAGIEPMSIVDGPGLRFTLFVQGCPHHCKGCHNPQTHDFYKPVNRLSIDEIYNKIMKNAKYIKAVTFSGGEPFMYDYQLAMLAYKLKSNDSNFQLLAYTGFTIEKLMNTSLLLQYLDFLIDGLFIEEKKSLELKFRGSSNQRIIDVQETLHTDIVAICNL